MAMLFKEKPNDCTVSRFNTERWIGRRPEEIQQHYNNIRHLSTKKCVNENATWNEGIKIAFFV